MAVVETNVTSSVDTSQLWIGFNCIESWHLTNTTGKTCGRAREPRLCSLSVDRVVALLEFNVSNQEFGTTVPCLKDPTKSWRYRSQWNAAHGNHPSKIQDLCWAPDRTRRREPRIKSKVAKQAVFWNPFLLIGLLCHRFHVHLNHT